MIAAGVAQADAVIENEKTASYAYCAMATRQAQSFFGQPYKSIFRVKADEYSRIGSERDDEHFAYILLHGLEEIVKLNREEAFQAAKFCMEHLN